MYIFLKTFTVLSSLILMNFILLFLSNIYLSFNNIYIIEEDAISYYNNNYLLILLSIILFFIVWYIFYTVNKYKINKVNSYTKRYPHQNLNIFLLSCTIIILFISYINIFVLSSLPPFFGEGYINRIGYLEETKLWFIMKPFGSVLIIVPIILGYLKANKYYYSKSSSSLYIIFILYILYLIFIGQKFSGMLLGIFYFILPQLVLMIQEKKKLITFNRIILLLFLAIFFFIILVFHYSLNPIAIEMGGPVKFIFYRIFALQGHMSWGYYNYYDFLNFEPLKMYDAMHNMMRTVGDPTIVESMIERNVNFTGAFPTIVFFSFPIGINFLVLGMIFYLYVKFSFYLLQSIDTIYYIFFIYIFNYIIIYFSRGSIEEIINFKVLGLFMMILITKMLSVISSKRKYADAMA